VNRLHGSAGMAADWKDLAVSIDARLKACCAMPISNFGSLFNNEVQNGLLVCLEKVAGSELLIVGGVTQIFKKWLNYQHIGLVVSGWLRYETCLAAIPNRGVSQ
jgi:hypothetical protein